MRNCPHCGKEIQDEAAFCRFCRRDVEPPLWLTSLQKCPYCAEWVERGIDRCPLCGKALITEEPFYSSEEADSTERLLNEVRENIFSKDRPADAEEEEAPEFEPPVESPFQRIQQEEKPYREPSSDPFESQEGLGVLRGRQRDEIPVEAFEDESTQQKPREKSPVRIRIPIRRILPYLILISASVAVIAGAVYAFQAFDLLATFGLAGIPGSAASPSPLPTETPAQDLQPTSTYVAATLPPLPTEEGTPGECILWSEITEAMEGQEVCAFGILKRRFRVDSEIPYMAIFSEEQGTFAIVDRLTFYTQFLPGDCIQAVGEIELMRGSRPFIDAGNALNACPEESE